MSRDVGVLRDDTGLARILAMLADTPTIDPTGREGGLTLADLEMTSLHTASTLVALAARVRTESRGCHRRTDHPDQDGSWARRLVVRADDDDAVVHAGPAVAA